MDPALTLSDNVAEASQYYRVFWQQGPLIQIHTYIQSSLLLNPPQIGRYIHAAHTLLLCKAGRVCNIHTYRALDCFLLSYAQWSVCVRMHVRTWVCTWICVCPLTTDYIKTDRKLITCGSTVVYYFLLVKLNRTQVDTRLHYMCSKTTKVSLVLTIMQKICMLYVCTCTVYCTHTHTHTHTHACTHTHTHARTHACTHAQTHTSTTTHTHQQNTHTHQQKNTQIAHIFQISKKTWCGLIVPAICRRGNRRLLCWQMMQHLSKCQPKMQRRGRNR